MKIAQAAATPTYRAVTAADQRIDREIGNSDGFVDAQELAVAVAAREVFEATGLNLRPQLRYGVTRSYTDADALGPFTVYNRDDTALRLGYVVFHEAGHVAHADRYRRDLPDPALELRADAYAGALIRATSENLTQGVAVRADALTDAQHGTPQQGAAAMLAGYMGKWW